jgi:serine/threonine-protein kinase
VSSSVNPAHTEFVPDGGARVSSETQFVPDLPRFGRYRALSSLGAGGMGTVYRAEDEVLGRPVAVKVLHSHGDPAARERFLREARAFGAVPHDNILAIYDAGTAGETPYLVMELAPGGSLRDRLTAGPLEPEVVRRIGIQIARALAAAHGAGILHRDVKPGNILAVEGERWKLADFGIARMPDSQLTVAGQFLGSPSYAAPESLRAGEFSPAADVYGLGATLYEAIAGVPPHGDHDMRSLLRKLEAPAPPLRELRAVPPSLEAAIMAAVALEPAQRPSAEELASRLAAFEDSMIVAPIAVPVEAPGAASGAAAIAAPNAAPASRSRRRLLVGALLAAAVLALAILADGGSSPAASGARDSRLPASPFLGPIGGQTAPAAAPGTSSDPARSGQPGEAGAPDQPEQPEQPEQPGEPRSRYVDQYGNPMDEATARRLLEQREQQPRARGRGRGKKHKYKGRD